MTAAIALRDVFRIHTTDDGDAAALQGLTLEVAAQEIVVVLGPSGAGKTTLLRIVAGLERISAGSVHVFGIDVARLGRGAAAAFRADTVAYADQHYGRMLAPELTARRAVAVPLELAGVRRRDALARADELLERAGLGERRNAVPGELSGGEQQRVSLCAALARRPAVFLADEPTGELDAASAALAYELIGDLAREERCTALIVSHDPESALVADRVVELRDGRITAETHRCASPVPTLVVTRTGWLRLPDDVRSGAGIGERATARLDPEGVVVAAPAVPSDKVSQAIGARDDGGNPADRVEPRTVAEVRALAKQFGSSRPIFRDFTANFAAGQLIAISGPSGSGKTTLLRLLAGLELPSAGDVRILGEPIALLDRAGRADVRRRLVALVPQGSALLPQLTARENVELALGLRGSDAAGGRAAAANALAAVGLERLADQRVGRLSIGERQRAAVARAVAARPALLLADEPTSRLDEANSLDVARLLAWLAHEHGTAVLCATHDPRVVAQADAEVRLDS